MQIERFLLRGASKTTTKREKKESKSIFNKHKMLYINHVFFAQKMTSIDKLLPQRPS